MPSAALPAMDFPVATMHPRTWTWGTSTSTVKNAMYFKPLPAGPSDQQPIARLSVAGPTHAPILDPAYLSNANLNDGGPIGMPPCKLDYEKPLDNDGKLELGYKSILRESNEDQQFWQRDSAGTPFVQAYDFRYREDIHAGLCHLGKEIRGLGRASRRTWRSRLHHGRTARETALTLPPHWPNSAAQTPPSSTTTPASTLPATSATR